MTAVLLGFGGYGAHEIQVAFDPINLIPKNSYLRDWFDVNELNNPPAAVRNYLLNLRYYILIDRKFFI